MMSEELNYFASFPEELKGLRGKHVALMGKKVVASGDNAMEVYRKAKERFPDKKPVLAYVPREETRALIMERICRKSSRNQNNYS